MHILNVTLGLIVWMCLCKWKQDKKISTEFNILCSTWNSSCANSVSKTTLSAQTSPPSYESEFTFTGYSWISFCISKNAHEQIMLKSICIKLHTQVLLFVWSRHIPGNKRYQHYGAECKMKQHTLGLWPDTLKICITVFLILLFTS